MIYCSWPITWCKICYQPQKPKTTWIIKHLLHESDVLNRWKFSKEYLHEPMWSMDSNSKIDKPIPPQNPSFSFCGVNSAFCGVNSALILKLSFPLWIQNKQRPHHPHPWYKGWTPNWKRLAREEICTKFPPGHTSHMSEGSDIEMYT